ncbi:hypothetical protein L2E82_28931 [Cichorium intybus]|uniref:Uncharacterized protein n=1 Tax=Cichorium intybus TaxID=13427 RepID=A0ACB9CWT6_CICIN|nr:hypothetical protein L2E82_28931 [Cichorium intybus]
MTSRTQLEDVPELMQQIQAWLPLLEAARTSVLSKSWLHAWSTIPILSLEELSLTAASSGVHSEDDAGSSKLASLSRYCCAIMEEKRLTKRKREGKGCSRKHHRRRRSEESSEEKPWNKSIISNNQIKNSWEEEKHEHVMLKSAKAGRGERWWCISKGLKAVNMARKKNIECHPYDVLQTMAEASRQAAGGDENDSGKRGRGLSSSPPISSSQTHWRAGKVGNGSISIGTGKLITGATKKPKRFHSACFILNKFSKLALYKKLQWQKLEDKYEADLPECSAGDGVRESVAGMMHLRIQANVDEALGYGIGEAVARMQHRRGCPMDEMSPELQR